MQVLEDGSASYDIALPDTAAEVVEAAESDTAGSGFATHRFASYSIEDAHIIYDDATMPMRAELWGFNHKGSGDFTESNFDLRTETVSEQTTVVYDGIAYLSKSELDAEIDMNIDIAKDLIIKLLDNNIRINALQMAIDGQIDMPGDDINMDLDFSSPQTDFGSIFLWFRVYSQKILATSRQMENWSWKDIARHI